MSVEELERMAADRPLATVEVHASNDYYGHATVLKEYAGLPPKRPLKAAIEHGAPVTDLIWQVDLQTRMPLFLCAARERAERYNKLAGGGRRGEAIGPMIAYAHAVGDTQKEPDCRRLVVFPAHSTHHVQANYDVAEFVARLAPYRDDWGEVQVCLYWRDVTLGTHRRYIENGFGCVTAGHMYDPRFLGRLRAILEGADAVVSNEMGTHMLYATLLDKPAWLLRQPIEYSAESREILERDGASARHHAERTIGRLRELFAEAQGTVTADQREFVADLVGLKEVRTPEQIRDLLLDAEQRYRARHPAHLRAALNVNARLRHARARLRPSREPRQPFRPANHMLDDIPASTRKS
jgi:hypothetical protein